MKTTAAILGAALALPISFSAMPALAQETLKLGTLTCDVSAGLGVIIASSRDLSCTFQPSRGKTETYRGSISRVGLDIGATTKGVLVWGVVATKRDVAAGSLAGDYVGASAEVSAGAGLGVNALVGGSGRSIGLQPVSVQGQVGLNLAAGVAQLKLVQAR